MSTGWAIAYCAIGLGAGVGGTLAWLQSDGLSPITRYLRVVGYGVMSGGLAGSIGLVVGHLIQELVG